MRQTWTPLLGLGSEEDIAQASARIAEMGAGSASFYHAADLRDPGQIDTMLVEFRDRPGPIDILANNAGIQHTVRIESFPRANWDDSLAVNISSAIHTTAAVLPRMRQQDCGRIITIASVHGLVASKEKAAYVAAKHGIVGLTKVTVPENAEVNVTCNAICPAWVLTPL